VQTLLFQFHIPKQREIVKEYNVIQNRIILNQQLIQKLEETAQAIYKEWFVEGIDLENLPEGWRVDSFYLLLNLCSTDSKNALLGISQSGSTREAITKSEIEEFEIIVPDTDKLKEFESQMQKLFSYKD
jgi:restriction endonuclease S subunit